MRQVWENWEPGYNCNCARRETINVFFTYVMVADNLSDKPRGIFAKNCQFSFHFSFPKTLMIALGTVVKMEQHAMTS